MSDRPDRVAEAFDALRADAGSLDTAEPLRSVTRHRHRPLVGRVILGGALAVVIVLLGLVFLRDDGGDDVVAGSPDTAGDGATDGVDVVDVGSLPGTSWTLVEGRGPGGEVQLVDGWPITLAFDPQSLDGRAACNSYGAEYTIDGDEITIGELSGTAVACVEPVMELEAAFLAALREADTVGLSDDRLVLSGPSTELRFALNALVPAADLIGQLWLLDTLIQGEVSASVRGDPATLLLNQDGTLVGSTGCRALSGEYVISGNQILFTSFAADGDCPSQLRDQDNIVISVLGDGFTAEIEGDRLTLTSVGNEGLGYRSVTEEELAEISGEPVPTDAEVLAGTSWVLTAGEGPRGPIEMAPGSEPMIEFLADPGSVTGDLSCNDFGADATFQGTQLRLTAIVQEVQLCLEPAVMAAEGAFRSALEDVTEFAVENGGNLLIMTGASTELLFDLERPEDPAALDVSRLLDEQPTGTVVVVGAAIPSGGGWMLCDRADPDGFAGCGGRWVTVTNFVAGEDDIGEGSWEGSLTGDGRFAITDRDPGIAPTAVERAIADAFVNLSVDGTSVDTSGLGLADSVLLGLGDELIVERTATQLADLEAWELSLDGFRARVGPFSAAELLRQGGETDVVVEPAGDGLELIVGPHDHCASPPAPISEQIAYESHLSLQPTGIDSCLQWFTIDVFLNGEGEVVAVTLDLYEP